MIDTVISVSADGEEKLTYHTGTDYATVSRQRLDVDCSDWVVVDAVVLGFSDAAKLSELLDTFASTRPPKCHNNIQWSVLDGCVLLNGVVGCMCTDDYQLSAVQLTSRLLTANRSATLFKGMPRLSDVESEDWLVDRLHAITETMEF